MPKKTKMGTEAFGYFKNLSPAFRPYVQTLCEELKLGKPKNLNRILSCCKNNNSTPEL